MNEFENKILQTTIAYLIEWNLHEVASLLVESELNLNYSSYGFDNHLEEIVIDLPISTYNIVEKNDYFKKAISRAINKVTYKHIEAQDSELLVAFRVKLINIEANWKEKIKELISNFKDPNQGNITEIVFKRKKEAPYIYNEMKFASKSEIKIAMEFEQQKVIFFPLPLAVRADTGSAFKDHREVSNSVYGISKLKFDRYPLSINVIFKLK